MNSLSSTRCIYEENSAGSSGGVFQIDGPHNFYSEHNVYLRNKAATGSVLGAGSIYINIVITGDSIQSNTANAATFYAGDLSTVYISDTEFLNNTSEGPSVYISNSVKSLSCTKCLFWQNVAEADGVLSISRAEHVTLSYLQVTQNTATRGSMIMVKKSTNTTLFSCYFKDNYCSDISCALSVKESDNVKVEDFLLVNALSVRNAISQSESKQSAVEIDARNIAIENVYVTGVTGYVYKGISILSLFFKNVSYECPKSHVHNSNITNTNLQSIKNYPNDLENNTALTLQCLLCSENYYRFGLRSLTFMYLGDLYHPNANGECYKCPTGGICDGQNVVSYPNYYGFLYRDRLKFVFCSDEFCCQPGYCSTYNGCNEGREGNLCTSCKSGFQLGIVRNTCLLKEKCAEGWLYGIMVISGFVYVGFLVAKVDIMNILQQIHLIVLKCKERIKAYRGNKRSAKIKKVSIIGFKNATESQVTVNEAVHDGWEWQVPFDHIEIFHILVFHLQDASLFQIRFPGMQNSAVQLGEFKEKLISIVRLNSLTFWNNFTCFPSGWTQLNKILFESSIISVMICILLLCIMLIKILRKQPNIKNRLMSSACRVFLLTFLFSSQRLCSYALNFITCEDLGPARYLFIDTTIECSHRLRWVI